MNILEILRKPVRHSLFHATFWLIGINVVLFFFTHMNLQVFLILMLQSGKIPGTVYFWQPFTYMFLHKDLGHLILNMFGLFVFGYPLEKRLGSLEFLFLYLFTGLATGILLFILRIGGVGASAAIYGLLLGYATFYPDSTLLYGFIIPIKARIAVIIFIVISLILHFADRSSNIGHLGHLAGIVFSFIYFIVRLDINPIKIIFRK